MLYLFVMIWWMTRRQIKEADLVRLTAENLLPPGSGPLLCAGFGGLVDGPAWPSRGKVGDILLLTPDSLIQQRFYRLSSKVAPEIGEVTRIPLEGIESITPASRENGIKMISLRLKTGVAIRGGSGQDVVLKVSDAKAWYDVLAPMLPPPAKTPPPERRAMAVSLSTP